MNIMLCMLHLRFKFASFHMIRIELFISSLPAQARPALQSLLRAPAGRSAHGPLMAPEICVLASKSNRAVQCVVQAMSSLCPTTVHK